MGVDNSSRKISDTPKRRIGYLSYIVERTARQHRHRERINSIPVSDTPSNNDESGDASDSEFNSIRDEFMNSPPPADLEKVRVQWEFINSVLNKYYRNLTSKKTDFFDKIDLILDHNNVKKLI